MTNRPPSEAMESAARKLAALPALKEMADELNFFPVNLLIQLCEVHAERNGPVPDHALTLLPYLGQTALRALTDGGYIELVEDVSYAVHAFVPTEAGRALVASLVPPTPRARKKR